MNEGRNRGYEKRKYEYKDEYREEWGKDGKEHNERGQTEQNGTSK